MGKLVFISHASPDKALVEQLCDELTAFGVEAWVSTRDISAGVAFDRAIQDALDEASHVVVLTTQSTINSAYVRAEVEYALTAGKTVIPVMAEENIRVPVRWHVLQRIEWETRSPDALTELAALLPKNSRQRLEQFLDDPSEWVSLRELLRKNPQWIHPHAAAASGDYGGYDFFYAKSHTGGNYKHVFYLASPYEPPFDEDGRVRESFQHVLDKASGDIEPGMVTRMLGNNLTEIVIFAGQRTHYTNTMYLLRDRLVKDWPQAQIDRYAAVMRGRMTISLDIASYTRLLEHIKSAG